MPHGLWMIKWYSLLTQASYLIYNFRSQPPHDTSTINLYVCGASDALENYVMMSQNNVQIKDPTISQKNTYEIAL